MEGATLTGFVVALGLCVVVVVAQVLCNIFVTLDQAAAF